MSVNPDRLNLLVDHIRLLLLERNRTNSTDAHVERNLDTLHQGIEALEKEQTRMEEHGEVSSKDLRAKEDVLIQLRKHYDEFYAQHQTRREERTSASKRNDVRDQTAEARSSMDQSRGLPDDDEEAARNALMGARAVPSALRKSKTVRFTDNVVENEDMDNTQILQMHQRIMDEQDESLDALSASISRQREISVQIGDELDSHVELLDDTDRLVDRTQGSLNGARKRLTNISRKAKDHGSLVTIAILIIVLILLIIITK